MYHDKGMQTKLRMRNILEIIQYCYSRNDNAYINAIVHFVASHMAEVVQLPGWKLLNAELRAAVLEQAAMTMGINCYGHDYDSCSSDDTSNHQLEPKLEFFHQKETFGPHQMFLKNTGNCRLAFKLVSYFGSGLLGGDTIVHPQFLGIGETKVLPKADDIYFGRHNHKYVVSYAGVGGDKESAENVLAIQATNKTFNLEF